MSAIRRTQFCFSLCLLLLSAGWQPGLTARQTATVPVLSGKWTLVSTASLPPSAPTAVSQFRIGAMGPDGKKIAEPRKISSGPPVYPPQARDARIGGQVILDATIDKQGYVKNLRVLRSVPGLDDAAVAAVAQWQYTPTLVAGEPVEVLMSVTITFSIGGGEAGKPRPIEINQDTTTLKLKRPMGSGSATSTYRFDGMAIKNKILDTTYTYVSHWDGSKLVTHIAWTSSTGTMESIETMSIEGDRLIVDVARDGGASPVVRSVYARAK